jgi:hypothetical protein
LTQPVGAAERRRTGLWRQGGLTGAAPQVSEETVFATDGSPAPLAVRTRLEEFRFYRDVINKFGRTRARRGDPGGLDDTVFGGDADDSGFIESMDSWFRDASGGQVQFTGNEGNGEETEYSCYVLVERRRRRGRRGGPSRDRAARTDRMERARASEADVVVCLSLWFPRT